MFIGISQIDLRALLPLQNMVEIWKSNMMSISKKGGKIGKDEVYTTAGWLRNTSPTFQTGRNQSEFRHAIQATQQRTFQAWPWPHGI